MPKDDDEEGCDACELAVSIGTSLRICRQLGNKKKCKELLDKVTNEEITADEVFKTVRKMAKGDKKALSLMDEVEKFAGRGKKRQSKSKKKKKR